MLNPYLINFSHEVACRLSLNFICETNLTLAIALRFIPFSLQNFLTSSAQSIFRYFSFVLEAILSFHISFLFRKLISCITSTLKSI